MAQTKATKKFEKRHLKDTLERRKGGKKMKQKQQLKARKTARRVEEDGRPASSQAQERQDGVSLSKKDAFQHMSVDDFFQSAGFEIPELPQKKGSKRKRDEDEATDEASSADASFEREPVHVDDGSEADSEEGFDDHKQQLDALAENDPEFHQYLQENEPELLNAHLDGEVALSEEGDEPMRKKPKKSEATVNDYSDEEITTARRENELDQVTIKKWRAALRSQHSLRAAKEVVLAFRSAAQVSEDEDREFKYSISDPDVYHLLLTTALKHVPAVFEHHLPVQENKGGKVYVSTESKKFKALAPLLKSQVASILHLLSHLTDAPTLRLTLSSILPLLPYLLSFKKLVRDLARASAIAWSTSSNMEATRIAAFLVLRRLVTLGDSGIRENVLKAAYQGLVKGSRNTTMHTISGVNLMKNSAAELWGLADNGVAYTTAFNFVRQLAIHLRSSITNNSNEGYKAVYNWQYVHSLDFWSRVLASHATSVSSPLRPLIYPLVQVTLGALRLIPTATYFPLRFQLVRSLLRISLSTNTYIPFAPTLYEVLTSAEMRKAPKASTLKPLDFSTSIRAAKSYLRTRVYQDGVAEQVQELLSEFFMLWAKNVAFPELALPLIIMLKRWLKDVNSREPGKGNRNQKVNGMITMLVQKLEANSRFIEERRAKVEFAPNNRKAVEGFLQDLEWQKTPLGAYVMGQRKTREEKTRLVEEGRKEESRRESEKKSGRSAAEAEEMNGSENGDDAEDEREDVLDGNEEEEPAN